MIHPCLKITQVLIPPVKDDEDIEESTNLLKLTEQEKYDQYDLVLLTNMDIAIPVKTQELKHQVRNIVELAGRCFGDSSILYTIIKTIPLTLSLSTPSSVDLPAHANHSNHHYMRC